MARFPRYSVQLVRESSSTYCASKFKIDTPVAAAEMLAKFTRHLQNSPTEVVVSMALDAKLLPIGDYEVSTGTLTSSLASPALVFTPALLMNAHSIILAHTHPSGDPTPSNDDVELTRRLIQAGRLLGLEVHDHIILYYSEPQSVWTGSSIRLQLPYLFSKE